jgi:starch phosphorylase
VPTWDSVLSDDLWTEACGKGRRVSDTTLWKFRAAASKSLVEYARGRLCRQLAVSGASHEAIDGAKHLFDPNALTPGILPQWTYLRAR